MHPESLDLNLISPNTAFPWKHRPAVLTVTDEDGDSVQINHVFVEDEDVQVWLTATGEDGQRVQVALSEAALRQLGEHLLDEAEDQS